MATDPNDAMRRAAREVLDDLMRGLAGDAPASQWMNGHAPARGNGNGNGHDREIVPQVPAPPVAAVLRPSTWAGPPAPGEVIGDRPARAPAPTRAPAPAPAPPAAPRSDSGARPALPGVLAPDVRVEPVTIETDADLDQFVRALVARTENPRDRLAIRAGRLRFALRRSATASPNANANPDADAGAGAAVVRVPKGAVTERAVRDAAAAGARLVLGRGAVLTPLARDRANALGVQIERERAC
jgi:hypothetical protein